MSKVRAYALDRLRHILSACDTIAIYIARGRDAFDNDSTIRDAVFYQIIVIGEAAKAAVSADPSIETDIAGVELSPWAKMRDFLTHQYWRTDNEIVWSTAAADVPALAAGIRTFMIDAAS